MQHLNVIVLLVLLVALINSAPISDTSNTKPVTLVKFVNDPLNEDTGKYKFEYEASDGQDRQEIGQLMKNEDGVEYLFVRGSYSYIGPDGVFYSVFYTADENGFRATGDHIPGKENEKPITQLDYNAIKSLVG